MGTDPDSVDVAAGAEVHDGVGAVLQGDLQFAEFGFRIRHVPAGAEVGVYLDAEALSDGRGLRIVNGVAGHHDASRRDTVENESLGHSFLAGNRFDPVVNGSSSGGFHDGAHRLS